MIFKTESIFKNSRRTMTISQDVYISLYKEMKTTKQQEVSFLYDMNSKTIYVERGKKNLTCCK